MAVASGVTRSTLNPNAPLFIPAAFRQVEDFSPEWWDLVKTSTWFREYWFQQHQGQQSFDSGDDEDDVVNMLPESFDFGVEDQLSHFEGLDESVFHDAFLPVNDLSPHVQRDSFKSGRDADGLFRSLNLKSPKAGAVKSLESPSTGISLFRSSVRSTAPAASSNSHAEAVHHCIGYPCSKTDLFARPCKKNLIRQVVVSG